MKDRVVRNAVFVPPGRTDHWEKVIDAVLVDMEARGYSERTCQDNARKIRHFGSWMEERGITVDSLKESVVEEYLATFHPAGNSVEPSRRAICAVRAALRRLLCTLLGKAAIAPLSPTKVSPAEALVRQFLEHAVQCQGLSASTCDQRGRYVRKLLAARFPTGEVDVRMITVRDLREFVAALAQRGQTRAAKCAASGLRAFLRFLVLQGMCSQELGGAVPTVAHRGNQLPRALNDKQIQQLLASFDRSTAIGRRDHAITICLARLGLRVGEVVGLRLQDVNWREGTLRIMTGKSRRASSLPLPVDVGRAIARYIKEARPKTADRHVFVTHLVPAGRGLNASAARSAVRRAFEHAGLAVVSKGTHTLRHTVATRMVCQGASIKEVADVLRHRSLDTTAQYAKVDLPALRSVAAPWPEARQ